jgi:hypothetical protein
MNDYDKNVFLNYPFQETHQPIVDAMIFGILACGFCPRSAEEEVGTLDQRIDRLVKLVSECKHGVHDLSESTSVPSGHPRLNMPFELGIFYGAKRLGDRKQREKQALIFDEVLHRNHACLSDSSGLDLQPHRRQPAIALVSIQRYLKRYAEWSVVAPAPILKFFLEYIGDVPKWSAELGLIPEQLSFEERRGLMAIWLQRKAEQGNTPLR